VTTNLFQSARPDEATLTAAFGTRPPTLFTRFLQAIFDHSAGDPKEASDCFERLTGLRSSGMNTLYDNTPRELFAIGNTGGDGEHAGFLVHAPERPADDYPWALFAPPGAELDLLAPDTATFLRQAMSYRLPNDPKDSEKILAIATAVGIQLDPDFGRTLAYLGQRQWWKATPPIKPEVVPSVPEDWLYEPAPDGVGVLAPAKAFSPEGPIDLQARAPSESILIAQGALDDGFPATALLAARSLYDDDPDSRAGQCMKRAYRALGRDLLAARMDS